MEKITFQLTDMSIAGGVERVVSIWANFFADKKKVKVVWENDKQPFYKLDSKIENEKLNYFSNIKFLPFIRLHIFYKFLKSRDNNEYVIFNKYMPTHSLYILRKLGMFKNINLIYFAHGGSSDFVNFYKKYQTNKIFKTYDKIICLYDDLDESSNFKYRGKINIINNPVSIKIDKDIKLNFNNILTVGRLSYPKGYDMLLESWKIVVSKVPNIKLNIVGSGELEKELKKQCNNLNLDDSVNFIPATSDIENYYLNSSIFLSSSRYEGMPMVVLEAMEAGLPIIGYDIKANKKLIKDNGILVPSYDIDKFAESIIELINDKSRIKDMSRKSKLYAKDYSIEKIYHLWNNILDN